MIAQDTQLPPEIKEQPARAYAHCAIARCPGNRQEEVDAILVTTIWSYIALGGDWPFPERSAEDLRFADPETAPCAHCGRSRELTRHPRPSYDGSVAEQELGVRIDPNALLDLQDRGIEFDDKRKVQDSELAALREANARLEGQMSVLMAQFGAQTPDTPSEPEVEPED